MSRVRTDLAGLDPRAVRRWRTVICLAFAIGGITVASWGARLPALVDDLDVDTRTIGLLLAGVTVGSTGGFLAAAPLLGRLGSRRSIGGAVLVLGGGLVALGLAVGAGTPVAAAVAFAVVGLGVGTMDVLINVDGAAIELALGRTVLPFMHGAWSVGVAVGAGLGAGCAAGGVDASSQLVAEGVAIAVLAVVIAPSIPAGTRSDETSPLSSGVSSAASRGQRLRDWARCWLDRRLLLIGLVMFGVELGEGSANSWLTLATHEDHGRSVSLAAVFFAVFAVSEAVARLAGGPVVDRLGRVAAIRWTTGAGMLGLLLFILTGWTVTLLAGIVLWALGVSMGFPLGMSAAADGGPGAAARVSVVAFFGGFANIAGPPVIGLLAGAVGLLPALLVVVALFVAGFAAAGGLRPVGAETDPGQPRASNT